MSSKSTRQRQRFLCLDCRVDTGKIKEFYYIELSLWLRIVGSKDGMLCIRCCEKRLGRKLNCADFTDATINNPQYGGGKSSLLMQRMYSG